MNTTNDTHVVSCAKEMTPWGRLALSVVVLLLIFCRCPQLIYEPRFWAEEGMAYFAFAYANPWLNALIAPHYGYYGLVPNLATILATCVPLEHAPLVTTLFAFLVQLLVSFYVIFYDSPYWNSMSKKLLVACMIQILCPFECWLTTVSSQYFLYIVIIFVLLETPEMQLRWRKWCSRAAIVISGLNGPATMFLLPMFLVKPFKTKAREDWLRLFLSLATSIVQISAFCYIRFGHSSLQLQGRFDTSKFSLFHIAKIHLADAAVGWYPFNLQVESTGRTILYLLLGLAMLLVCYFSYLLVKNLLDQQVRRLVMAFLLLTLPSVLLSQYMASSPRAAFAPVIILLLLLIHEVSNIRLNHVTRGVAIVVLSLMLLSGLMSHRSRVYYAPGLPQWKDEVRTWRLDKSHALAIWPERDSKWDFSDWYVKLSDNEQK